MRKSLRHFQEKKTAEEAMKEAGKMINGMTQL